MLSVGEVPIAGKNEEKKKHRKEFVVFLKLQHMTFLDNIYGDIGFTLYSYFLACFFSE